MTAMEVVLAEIDAACAASNARRDRLANDPRMIRLRAEIDACSDEVTLNGRPGFDQMMGQLVSSRNMRARRAGSLLRARQHQISGYRPGVLSELHAAARRRNAERSRRAAETIDAHLAAIDRILADPASTPSPVLALGA